MIKLTVFRKGKFLKRKTYIAQSKRLGPVHTWRQLQGFLTLSTCHQR